MEHVKQLTLEHLVCRSCGFNWATSEGVHSSGDRPASLLTLVFSRDRDATRDVACGRGLAVVFPMSDAHSSERRDVAAREALLDDFLKEIRHNPGLAFTLDQASRLFGLPREVCERLLGDLVRRGALQVRSDGRFVGVRP